MDGRAPVPRNKIFRFYFIFTFCVCVQLRTPKKAQLFCEMKNERNSKKAPFTINSWNASLFLSFVVCICVQVTKSPAVCPVRFHVSQSRSNEHNKQPRQPGHAWKESISRVLTTPSLAPVPASAICLGITLKTAPRTTRFLKHVNCRCCK